MRIFKLCFTAVISIVLYGCSSGNSIPDTNFDILDLNEFNLISLTKYEYTGEPKASIIDLDEDQSEDLYDMLIELNSKLDPNDFIDASNLDGPTMDYSIKLESADVDAYIGFNILDDPTTAMVFLTYNYDDGTRDYYITDSGNNKFYDLTDLYDFLIILW